MAISKFNLCRRCALSLRAESKFLQLQASVHRTRPTHALTRSFFSKRSLSKKPVLQLSAPDPSSPDSSSSSSAPSIQRDPGVLLGNNGIPVPPSPSSASKKDYIEEKSWAETVFRTLSGGMKSEYLKCTYFLPENQKLMIGTELDEHGNVRVGMQAFKKMELCTMVNSAGDYG